MRLYIFFALALVLNSTFSLYAQYSPIQQKTIERAQQYIEEAKVHYINMNYEKAKASYQFAANLYRKHNLPAYYALCYNGVGNILLDQTQFSRAKIEGFERSLLLLEKMPKIDSLFVVDSSLVADAYEGLGRYYMTASSTLKRQGEYITTVHYDTALTYHKKALKIRQRFSYQRPEKMALSYYYIAKCYNSFIKKDSSSNGLMNLDIGQREDDPIKKQLSLLNKAKEIQIHSIGENHHQTANTYEALGNFYYEVKGDYQEGLSWHQRALKIRETIFTAEHPKLADSYRNLATYYQIVHLYDEELRYLELALQIQQKVFGTEHLGVASVYHQLGKRYLRVGDSEKALSYFSLALNTFKKLQNDYSQSVGNVRLDIAMAYLALDKSKEAYESFMLCLEIQKRIYGPKHYNLIPLYYNIGDYYTYNEQLDSALFYYNKGLFISKKQLGNRHISVAKGFDKLAYTYRLLEQPKQEIEYLNKALAVIKNTPLQQFQNTSHQQFGMYEADLNMGMQNKSNDVSKNIGLYRIYIALADFYRRQHDNQLAIVYAQRALTISCSSIKNEAENIYANPSLDNLAENPEWIQGLALKGALFLELFKESKSSKHLEAATAIYKLSLQLIDRLRIELSSDAAKAQLTKRSINIYEGAIELYYILYQKTQSINYITKAFDIAEKSKASVLLQAHQTSFANNSGLLPKQYIQKERSLKHTLSQYTHNKQRLIKTDQNFESNFFKAKQAYDSFAVFLEENYPLYFNMKYKVQTASIDQVQQALSNKNEAWVEYFLGDGKLYIFTITEDNIEFDALPLPENYREKITAFRYSLSDYNLIGKNPEKAYEQLIKSSFDFYAVFVKRWHQKMPRSITEITIVPDGVLNYIPFEAILTKQVSQRPITPYNELAFLIKQATINYSYSASLFFKEKNKQKKKHNNRCLGIAPAYASDGLLEQLKWTQKEVQSIEKVFEGTYWYGKDAKSSTFKEKASQYGIIHLAMHGIVNMQNSQRSKLAFADQQNIDKAFMPDYLYAYELHNMQLQADLVVLSACETGIGKSIRGEGVQSLAHAFIYAGTPSVVSTLWKVNDFASAQLMRAFYQGIKNSAPKPTALRDAKLAYLNKADTWAGHPAFWASYVCIGAPNPIVKSSNFLFWLLALIGTLIFTGFLFHLKRSKKNLKAPK